MAGFGALEGLRILDLTQMLAGPFATMMLADHGADVVKIESPAGEMSRPYGPFFDDDLDKASGGYFMSINRNKKSVVLDLKSDVGKRAFLELVKSADAVVESFRIGVMDRLGLGYDVLKAVNPRLVYGCVTGFGDPRTGESPYARWPAFDVVAQAMGGIMGITGTDSESPLKIGPGVGDIIPGMMLAYGVLAALHHAHRTGEGQFVDVAMTDAILAVCERIVYQHSIQGKNPTPEGNHHPFICPFGVFPARDGFVAIAAPSNTFFEILCHQLGIAELVSDSSFDTQAHRTANKLDLQRLLSTRTQELTKAQLSERLGGKIPFGIVMHMADIATDPHFTARDMLTEIDTPGSAHRMTVAGVPVKMTKTPGAVRGSAPRLGGDTESVLRAAGLDSDTIDEIMRRAG